MIVMILLYFYCFGNMIIMLLLFDKLKTPRRRMKILSQMTEKACQSPPTKIMNQIGVKENPVVILMIKVCILLFGFSIS